MSEGLSDRRQILVLVIPAEEYQTYLPAIVRQIGREFKNILYVSLNKPYESILEMISENDLDSGKFTFIDGITKTADIPVEDTGCVFISSPSSLTELSLGISNLIEGREYDFMLFDSLSTLLVYESQAVVSKFLHFIIAKLRLRGVNTVFTCLNVDVETTLMKDLNMFVDRIVSVEEWGLKHG
jgi:archaellum biogenesis ATPase FlaH